MVEGAVHAVRRRRVWPVPLSAEGPDGRGGCDAGCLRQSHGPRSRLPQRGVPAHLADEDFHPPLSQSAARKPGSLAHAVPGPAVGPRRGHGGTEALEARDVVRRSLAQFDEETRKSRGALLPRRDDAGGGRRAAGALGPHDRQAAAQLRRQDLGQALRGDAQEDLP